MNVVRFTLAAVAALGACLPAAAQISLTLDNPVQSGLPGSTLSYTLTLVNTGGTTLSLDSISTGFAQPDLSVDLTPFFVNFPASLLAGQSVTAVGIEIAIAGTAAPGGPYADFLTVGWGGGSESSQAFSASVLSSGGGSAAPEPGTLALTLLGLAMAGGRVAYGRPATLLRNRARRSAG